MNKALLHSLQAPVLVGVQSTGGITVTTLIRLKKHVAEGTYDKDYDFNKDDVLDAQDIIICRKILLGMLNAEDYA